MRLKLKLAEFDYDTIYRKGKENSNSDGLSRMYTLITGTERSAGAPRGESEEENNVRPPATEGEVQERDRKPCETDVEAKEFSDKEKFEILKEVHETPICGHRAMSSTYKKLKHHVSWKRMKEDVESFIKKCEKCQKKIN
jgi:hypothetical protein